MPDISKAKHQQETSAKGLPVAYESEMHRMIQTSAYMLAEKDNFKESPVDYWLAAEKTVHTYF